jgi:hypothetical protein
MKHTIALVLSLLALSSYGQDKYNYIAYNKLTELTGTDYVIATVENRSKMSVENNYLLFIDTKTGENKQVDFPKDSYIERMEQLRIDSLGINKVFIAAKTVNLDGNKSIDWNDPRQIIILSVDGKEKIQLTEDKFFAGSWIINKQTGVIVITGHYDTNNNGKYDKTDKNEILLYDLKSMKPVTKI